MWKHVQFKFDEGHLWSRRLLAFRQGSGEDKAEDTLALDASW